MSLHGCMCETQTSGLPDTAESHKSVFLGEQVSASVYQ